MNDKLNILNTYDINDLKLSLLEIYKDNFNIVDYIDKKKEQSFYIILKNENIYDYVDLKISSANYDNIKLFNEILLIHNYYCSSYCKNNRKWCIFIDKIYSYDITDKLISNKYSLYYFTDKKIQNEILNGGIFCTNRIYLFATTKRITDPSIYTDIFKFIYKYCNLKKLLENDIGILKINLKSNIYNDNISNNENTVFICNAIKKEDVKEIKSKDITINNLFNINKHYQFNKKK